MAILRIILQRFATEMLFCFNMALIITLASTFQLFSLLATATQLQHAERKSSDAFNHVLLFILKLVRLTEKIIRY